MDGYQMAKSSAASRLRRPSVMALAAITLLFGAGWSAAQAGAATQYVAPSPPGLFNSSCALPRFNTIQSAVNASAPGDTIVVCAGSYPEQVTVEKSLTLAGSGNSIIQPTSLSGDLDVVDVSAGASVSMSGFTIAGPGASGCNSIHSGIAVFGGANLNLSSTTVQNIEDSPFGGCQNGEGIRIGTPRGSSTPDVGKATINNVSVTAYQKNGIVVAGELSNGTNSTAKITNSTVTGNGKTPTIAENGIEVVNGAAATISTSTIRDNFYTGPQNVSACGLLIIHASGVNDQNNVYLNNQKNKCTSAGRGGTFQG